VWLKNKQKQQAYSCQQSDLPVNICFSKSAGTGEHISHKTKAKILDALPLSVCEVKSSVMNKLNTTLFLVASLIFSCDSSTQRAPGIPPNQVVPSANQLAYQQMEQVGFIHFTVNTFTDKEWGYGDESPAIFNPTALDAEQWVLAAKAGGLKELILTAKHHDGFCLWPSEFTEHSVKNSPYKNGRGDIVREFVDACRKHGLKAGLYLSPWDRNHKDYGKPEYITYYRNQLTELLTNYGEIKEIWFDGANGGDGFYGGANEERRIDKDTYYDWETTMALAKELQPNILIFSDAGPDLRWVGNEHGFAGRTFWSTINAENLTIGGSDQDYLNVGDPGGDQWIIGQCDVSIRPGWFYHESQDSLVKSPPELVDIYYKSVGRNGVLLLNLPPDKRGLIHEKDVANLRAFRQIIDKTFAKDLARNKRVTASNYRLENDSFAPVNLVDGDPDTYWATDDKVSSAELIIDLNEDIAFDRILLQEPIALGQRVSQFEILIQNNQGDWESLARETTIGYKRLLRVNPVTTSKVKIKIMEASNTPALANFGLYLSAEGAARTD
jgi:alpha-L-fucosidase